MDWCRLWDGFLGIFLEDSHGILWFLRCCGLTRGLFFSRILTVTYGFGDVVGSLGGYFSRGFSWYPMVFVMLWIE